MIVVPTDKPEIEPEERPMVATAVLLLVQVPPGTELVTTVEEPTHTAVLPDIALGDKNTVTTLVLLQPAPAV